MKVTTTVEITPAMIADAMCSAFEAGAYGCRYWMPRAKKPAGLDLTDSERLEHCNWYSTPRTWTPGHGWVVFFYELDNEATGHMTLHRFEVDKLPERLQVLANGDPELFAQLVASDDDPLDGPASDNVLQWLLLGEVRYG